MCKVYEVALGPGASFKLVAAVRLPTAEIIRSISFSDNMLVLSRGSAINLIDITKKPRRNLLVLSPYSEDLEDMVSYCGHLPLTIYVHTSYTPPVEWDYRSARIPSLPLRLQSPLY